MYFQSFILFRCSLFWSWFKTLQYRILIVCTLLAFVVFLLLNQSHICWTANRNSNETALGFCILTQWDVSLGCLLSQLCLCIMISVCFRTILLHELEGITSFANHHKNFIAYKGKKKSLQTCESVQPLYNHWCYISTKWFILLELLDDWYGTP